MPAAYQPLPSAPHTGGGEGERERMLAGGIAASISESWAYMYIHEQSRI